MKKIGGGMPKITQAQTPNTVQQSGNNASQAGQASQTPSMPQSFEPSKQLLAQQGLPQANASQSTAGTIKAGLMHRGSAQVGGLLDNARQMLDKLDQQINWRQGRLTGQLTDFLRPSNPTEPPPIQAMYGVIMPGPIDVNPGQGSNPGISQPPPIAAMYGVIMPGPIDVNPEPPVNPGPPPIAAMYGVIMPGPGNGGGNNVPPIAAMYGVIMPGNGQWDTPIIQPKYGALRPPMIQVQPNSAQNN